MAVAGGLAAFCALAQEKLAPPGAVLPELERREVSTNSNPLARKDGLRALEEELSRSFQSFAPKSSLDGELAPQYRPSPQVPPAQNRRVQQLLDRRRNWATLTPEDMAKLLLTPDGTLGTTEYGPDGLPKTGVPGNPADADLEQMYGRGLNPGSLEGMDLFGPAKKLARPGDNGRDDGLPDEVKKRADQLRKLLEQDRAPNASPPSLGSGGTLSEFFGLGRQERTPAQLKAHKAYMDDYRKWLNQPALPGALAPDRAAAAAGHSASPGLGDYGLPSVMSKPDAAAGVLPRIPDPTAMRDPNATVLNQWNPLYVPPTPELPKVTIQPPPLDEAPRRKF
jgi:hypothetical protein